MNDEIPTCAELDEQLAPYVDGEASPESRRAVEAHLALCPPCRRLAEAEAAARTIVHGHREALRPHVPDALRARCDGFRRGSSDQAAATGSSPRTNQHSIV